jgi:hypothetical protein
VNVSAGVAGRLTHIRVGGLRSDPRHRMFPARSWGPFGTVGAQTENSREVTSDALGARVPGAAATFGGASGEGNLGGKSRVPL